MDKTRRDCFEPPVGPDGRRSFIDAPATPLPSWGGSVAGQDIRLILYPPTDFELSASFADYVAFMPFVPAIGDVALGEKRTRRRTLPAGAGLFVPPGIAVEARLQQPAEFLIVAAAPSRVEPSIQRAAGDRSWSKKAIPELIDDGIAALAREARRALLSDPLREPTYLESLTDAIMARFSCKMLRLAIGQTPKEALPPMLLRRLIKRIEESLSTGVSTDDLAAEAGLSRWHFSRAFQAATGLPPHDFLLTRRVAKARDLLADTDRPIAQIAAETGFSSHGHLTKAFRKRLGLTPAAYRRIFRKEV